MMTRAEALECADEVLLTLIASGDARIFEAAGNDARKVVQASLAVRGKLADRLMAFERGK